MAQNGSPRLAAIAVVMVAVLVVAVRPSTGFARPGHHGVAVHHRALSAEPSEPRDSDVQPLSHVQAQPVRNARFFHEPRCSFDRIPARGLQRLALTLHRLKLPPARDQSDPPL
jgi:hypothetical protein